MKHDLAAILGFVAFVVVGLVIALRSPTERSAARPPLRIQVLICIGAGLGILAGVSRRDLWPFANWTLIPGMTATDVRIPALVCADSAGLNVPIDHRAWSPLTEEELLAWIGGPFHSLAATTQDSARAALLGRAEAARQRVRSGGRASLWPSLLGPLAAHSHLLHPDLWNEPADAPARPCAALRYIERDWNVDSVAAGSGRIAERTLWQYPAAP
jgi:hypothetical protein